MNFTEIKQQEKENMMPAYGRFDVALVRGKGAIAIDSEGGEYIDFGSGIGVNSLGYCDAEWVKAVTEQACELQHISNLYYSPVQTALAEKLCGLTGYGKVFFGNSGAEANECAIKLARKYGNEALGGCDEIVTLENSFHGRTVTTLAATGQDVFHQHFTPFTEGFAYAKANDLDSVKAAVTDKTCAVMLEFIQGEGGVMPLDKAFVLELADFCRDKKILLIADEVQTGMGRTGKLFCYEHYNVMPDVITAAKGLGGGLPIGACLCKEELGNVIGPGMHGSTFGGNPVVCAGAGAVLNRVGNGDFLQAVQEKGEYLREKLTAMVGISSVRGIGMMLGAALTDGNAKEIAAQCLKAGLLILTAKDVLRLLPPLTITYEEIDKGLAVLAKVLQNKK